MSLLVYPTLPGLTLPVLKAADFDTLVETAPNKYRVALPQTVNPLWSWELIYDFLRDPPNIFAVVDSAVVFTIGDLGTLLDFFMFQSGQAGDFLFLDPDDNYVGPALVGGLPNIPMAQLQLVDDGVGNYYSPLQRTRGGLFYEDITDLNTNTGAGGSVMAIYVDGTLATAGPTLGQYSLLGPGLAIAGKSFMGMYLKWVGPPPWQAGHSYALNAEILDPAGHIQKATTAGVSGPDVPDFSETGGTTPDGAGALVWTDQGYNPGPGTLVTAQFNFYFRVHFQSDSQDMEKFAKNYYTIGGSESQNGKGYVKLEQSRPVPL